MGGANGISTAYGRSFFADWFGCRLKTMSRRVVAILFLTASLVQAQTDEVAPGKNVIVEGIPKIPASLRTAVNRYRAFYSSSLLAQQKTMTDI